MTTVGILARKRSARAPFLPGSRFADASAEEGERACPAIARKAKAGRGEGAHPPVVACGAETPNALGPGDWLSLAAAPTFAIMALLTGLFGGKPDVLCAVLEGTSPLSGMVPMYLLMSAFHLAPWLKLVFGQRDG
jgi:hypothetical protein